MSLSFVSTALRRAQALRQASLVLLAGILLAWTAHGHAAMYKWVDDKGVVHYTDKMPPEAVNRGNVELRQGVPVRKVDPAMTPEQRRAFEQDEERRRQAAKQQEEAARRDRALLASYTSEGEIDLARHRAVTTVEAAIQSSQSYSEQLTRRKAELAEKMAGFKGKQMPPVWERELENLTEELARQGELVVAKKKEIAIINTRYDAEKARYHEIASAKPAVERSSGAVTATPTALNK